MPIADLDAVKFGLLAMYAEDMYASGQTIPNNEPRIAQAGWEIVAWLTARDSILPTRAQLPQGAKKQLELGAVVFYGFLARKADDPSAYVAAVRGTAGLVEWIIDAEFVQIRYRDQPDAKVEQGFWGIYDSMDLVHLDGTVIGKAAEKIAEVVGGGHVTVTGHSLGSALATYLSLEVAQRLGERAAAVLFASPRAGNAAFAALYDHALQDRYRLFNYVLDMVPYVPFDLPLHNIHYATLGKPTIIDPMTSQAEVQVDIFCNHHVICYCAMLAYEYTKATAKSHDDAKLFKCVIGPRKWSMNEALAESLSVIFKYVAGETLVKELAKRLGWKAD
jgi:triacylglycerol lipase